MHTCSRSRQAQAYLAQVVAAYLESISLVTPKRMSERLTQAESAHAPKEKIRN